MQMVAMSHGGRVWWLGVVGCGWLWMVGGCGQWLAGWFGLVVGWFGGQ